MKCYYHHDRDAFGICKACGKGLCLDCMNTSNNMLKCKGNQNCTDRAQLINISYSNLQNGYSKSQKIISTVIGLLFFAPGLAGIIISFAIDDKFMLVPSLIFAAIGFAILNSTRKLKVD